MKKSKSFKDKGKHGGKRFSVKNFFVAVVGLIIIGSVLPGLVTSIGSINVAGCAELGGYDSATDTWNDAGAVDADVCSLNGVSIKAPFGHVIYDTIQLLRSAAFILAGILCIIGCIKWLVARATDDE